MKKEKKCAAMGADDGEQSSQSDQSYYRKKVEKGKEKLPPIDERESSLDSDWP